jgi:hypothetical protein
MHPQIPKETNMKYKTIVLELLKQHPEIHDRLRRSRMLLTTLDPYASDLKTRHEAWKDHLSRTMPGSHPSQIASEALEIALKELEDFLHSGAPPEGGEPPSLEGATAFIRGRTPHK